MIFRSSIFLKTSSSSNFKAEVSEAMLKVSLAHFPSCKHENLLDLDARIYGSAIISNGNRNEWNTIQGVIARVISNY